MKKTKLSGNYGNVKSVATRIISSGLILVFAIFMTSLNSLQAQQSSPDKMQASKLGKAGISEVVEILQNEISYLKQEMRSVTPQQKGSASISVGSPLQLGLINSYEHVSRRVQAGYNLRQEMLNVLTGPLFNGGHGSSATFNQAGNQELQNVIDFVINWDVSKGNMGDLVEALTMIRELI